MASLLFRVVNVGFNQLIEYFGSQKPYSTTSPQGSILKPPSHCCRPVQVTLVARHGTRFPKAKSIVKMHQVHELVLKEGSGPLMEDIKAGPMYYQEDMDGKLAEKGRDDHRHLAMRLSKLLPSLVNVTNLREGRVKFQTTSKERCRESVEAFQEGLQESWGTDEVMHYEVKNTILRAEKKTKGKKNKEEVEKYKCGEEMQRVRRRVAERLKIPHHHLTPDLVEAAFLLCCHDTSIRDLHSPWCQLFDKEDAKVVEYKEDLKRYWQSRHGCDNTNSSFPLFQDLFTRLDQSAQYSRSGKTVPEAVMVQVGHAETLMPLFSLLGLHEDQTPPTAHNFHTQHDRKFRSGRFIPYAANVIFVLYDCRRHGTRLQMLLNETPLRFPGLKEDAPPYMDVRRRYMELLGPMNRIIFPILWEDDSAHQLWMRINHSN